MKKLDWYIIRKFLGTFFFTIVLFASVAVVIDFSERLDDFIENSAPMNRILFDYYVNFVPWIVFFLFPLFVFIAVIFFTSRLAGNSEIIAMLAGGVSFYRILAGPYFFSALVLVVFQLYANHYLVPKSNYKRIMFENEYIRNINFSHLKNIHIQLKPGTNVYMQSFNARDTSGTGFTLEEFDGQELTYKLKAKKAKWNYGKGLWELADYESRKVKGLKEVIAKGAKLDTMPGLFPGDFETQVRFKDAMTTPELEEFVARERLKGASKVEYYEVERHNRSAIPFATFILTIIGFSLSSRKVRGGLGLNLLLGFGLSALYVLLLQFSMTFATQGNLSPLLSAWLPNIFFTTIAVYLLWRAPK